MMLGIPYSFKKQRSIKTWYLPFTAVMVLEIVFSCPESAIGIYVNKDSEMGDSVSLTGVRSNPKASLRLLSLRPCCLHSSLRAMCLAKGNAEEFRFTRVSFAVSLVRATE